ncbi:MAG: InlB B-repeat-containing protein [Oscillospiraceae bacterium]|nr:InlB B-repeat-containing protein [Oscillospiraceae bacterium]
MGVDAPETQIKTHDVDLTLSSKVPTREGYTFKGWSSSADGVPMYSAGDIYSQNADIVLYAIWEKNAASTVIASGNCGNFATWELTDGGVLTISGSYTIC